MYQRQMMGLTNVFQAYGIFHTSKLPFNAHTNVVENEFPKEELA